MVVVAGGEEGGVEAGGATVGGQVQAQRVAVEGERAIEVGDLQVHVADADGGVDGFALHGRQCPVARGARHRWNHVTGENRRLRAPDRTRARARRPRGRPGGGPRRRRARGRAGDRQVAAARVGRRRRRRWHGAGGARVGVRGRPAVRAVGSTRWARSRSAAATATGRTARCGTLLEELAAARPLVVCLDDVHWADPASREALARSSPAAGGRRAARARRTRAGPAVAAAGAVRGAPARAAERGRGARAGRRGGRRRLRRQRRQPVLPRAARAAGGRRRGARGDGLCRRRSRPRWRRSSAGSERTRGGCSTRRRWSATRSTLDLAAEVAELDGAATARARSTSCSPRRSSGTGGAPRRFAFRHPVVRHAVYEAAPGGWRLGAHARAAAALERRGAGPVERAHHVEQAAGAGRRGGDRAAERGGATSCSRPRPATARATTPPPCGSMPAGAAAARALQLRLADAQAAAGDAAGARDDAARRAAHGRARGAARAHRRGRQRGVVARPARPTRGGGCRSRSASCPPSRRPTASGCGSRSR